MKKLPQIMSEEQFQKYGTHQKDTGQCAEVICFGLGISQPGDRISVDETRGGLAHGRGVTAITQSKMVHILPRTAPMCESLWCFSGILYIHIQPTNTKTYGLLRRFVTVYTSRSFEHTSHSTHHYHTNVNGRTS